MISEIGPQTMHFWFLSMRLYSPNFMGLYMCIIISVFLIKDDVAILILTPENLVPEMWQIILSIKDDQAVSQSVMFLSSKKMSPRTLLQYWIVGFQFFIESSFKHITINFKFNLFKNSLFNLRKTWRIQKFEAVENLIINE